MEIPITLRFLERLNSFQAIGRIDKEKRPSWRIEKQILSWAADPRHHQHLNTQLTVEMALEHSEITGLEAGDHHNDAESIRQSLGNLVMRGYAVWRTENVGVVFTKEGFLAGETINDIRRGWFRRFRYLIVYWACWVIFFSGLIVAASEAIKDLMHLIEPMFKFLWAAFHKIVG
ncbi:MAG: hypothetical protein ACLQHF_00655 [Terracidiphilus sp.]